MTKLEEFNGIRGGDRVTFTKPSGLKLVGGRAVPEIRTFTAPAQMLLCMQREQGTVVVNMGGRYGTPAVVRIDNFVSVRKKA